MEGFGAIREKWQERAAPGERRTGRPNTMARIGTGLCAGMLDSRYGLGVSLLSFCGAKRRLGRPEILLRDPVWGR